MPSQNASLPAATTPAGTQPTWFYDTLVARPARVGSPTATVERADRPTYRGLNANRCHLCHENYGEEVPLTLHCGHTLGSNCLDKWLNGGRQLKDTCLYCRGRAYRSGSRQLNHSKYPDIHTDTCYICHEQFTEEVPLTLHCGHTVGSICLNEWLNGGQPPKQTCPFCRTKVYQTVFRRLDQDIEDAALRGIVDGVRIADTSTQGLLRDQILEDRRIEGLIYFKLTKMPSQFLDTDNYKISKPQAMDCILNAIGLYLMHASSKEDKSRPSRYGSLMTELLKYRQRNCPIELRAYRIELEKAIQTAIFLAYWLKIPYSNKSILLKQIIEKDGQVGFDPHPEDGDDMIRVARAAPRLLLALYWGTSPSASRFWRLDVQQLLKADVQLRGHYDGSNVYERMEDIPAHVSFRKPLVKKVLESWGITDVEAKASFNDCKYSRGRWVIDPSGGW